MLAPHTNVVIASKILYLDVKKKIVANSIAQLGVELILWKELCQFKTFLQKWN
jgi:hypothetical protein